MKPMICTGGATALALVLLFCMTAPAVANEADQKKAPETTTAFADIQDSVPNIPPVLTLEWCLKRARAANPALAEATALALAAEHRIRPAGALDDPRLAYDASNIPTGDFDFESTPLSGHQLGLRQKLPFPGLLSSRRTAARRGYESSDLLVEDRRLLTEGAVESAWAELAFAQQALDITDRNIDLLRQLAATAESRYRVGSGIQQDVLRAHVELTALLQERLRREESIERTSSRLVELLDLPAETDLPRTADLNSTETVPPLPTLLASLGQKNARLRSAEKRVEEARLRIRVAELEGLPDVDLGIGYRVRKSVPGDPVDGDNFLSAGFTVRLPLNRAKWRSKVAEQESLLRRAQAQLRGIRAQLGSQTRSAHAELVRASSEEALLETGLVPQARQSLAASRSAYKVGRVDFPSLLDSQVRLLGAELQLVRARADKRRAFAALETASGETLR
ncbi:MAG: TolC family protein [Myxococcota bacterium]|jgi:cobalt-zinc-cadmium efflux system outer membrane protein